MKEALSFDDVCLLDGFSEMSSRSLVWLKQKIGIYHLDLPVAIASMTTVNSGAMAHQAGFYGAMYVQHRYCSVEERIAVLSEWNPCTNGIVGVAVGLNETDDELERLIKAFDLISLDVAAANNINVIQRIEHIVGLIDDEKKDKLLMVGNFSNTESFVRRLNDHGLLYSIDLLKVAQGGGSVCSTRVNIGVGKPTFQAICDLRADLDYYHNPKDFDDVCPKIVGCGGIKSTGDIVKALGAGASLVMCGAMFAAHDECPGDVVKVDGQKFKQYKGMASASEKSGAGMSNRHIEGVSSLVPYKGPVADTYLKIRDNIKSGIATAGFKDINKFIGAGEFIRLTHAGNMEGRPHIEGKIYEH